MAWSETVEKEIKCQMTFEGIYVRALKAVEQLLLEMYFLNHG